MESSREVPAVGASAAPATQGGFLELGAPLGFAGNVSPAKLALVGVYPATLSGEQQAGEAPVAAAARRVPRQPTCRSRRHASVTMARVLGDPRPVTRHAVVSSGRDVSGGAIAAPDC